MDKETLNTRLNESDDLAIRKVASRAQDSQSDTESLMALHTSGTVVVNIAGRRVLGRDDFAAAMTAALSSPLKQVRTELEILDIRLATPHVAIVSCIKTVHDERDDAEDTTILPSTGALTYVMTKVEDTRQIAVAQTTPVN